MFVLSSAWILGLLSGILPSLKHPLVVDEHIPLKLYTNDGNSKSFDVCLESNNVYIVNRQKLASSGLDIKKPELESTISCLERIQSTKYNFFIQINRDSKQIILQSNGEAKKTTLYIGYYLPSQSLWISDSVLPSNEDFIQSSFSISPQFSLSLDWEMFLPHNHNTTTDLLGALSPSESVNNGEICQILQTKYTLQDMISSQSNPGPISVVDFPFLVTSDHRNRFLPNTLPYWLHYCNIKLPTIFIRNPLLPLSIEKENPFFQETVSSTVYDDSLCIVKHIQWDCTWCNQTFLEYAASVGALHERTFPCVEDVLDYYLQALRQLAPSTSSTTNNSSSPSDPYLSLSYLLQQDDQDVNNVKYHFVEVIVFLKAIANLPLSLLPSPLHVHLRSWQSASATAPIATSLISSAIEPLVQPNNNIISKVLLNSLPNQIPETVTSPPDITIGSQGNVYVLLIVPSNQLLVAEYLVDYRRRHCAKSTCHVFITYQILPVDLERSDSNATSYTALPFSTLPATPTVPEILSFLSQTPSYRTVLLEVEQYLQEMTVPTNIVYLFNGLSAFLSFPQPSIVPMHPIPSERLHSQQFFDFTRDCHANRPVIPIVEYAGRYNYCLDAEILIATADADDTNAVVEEVEIRMSGSGLQVNDNKAKQKQTKKQGVSTSSEVGNFDAMVGTVRSLQWWLQSTLSYYQLGQYHTNNKAIHEALNMHAHYHHKINPYLLKIDTQQRAFNSTYSTKFLHSLAQSVHDQLESKAKAMMKGPKKLKRLNHKKEPPVSSLDKESNIMIKDLTEIVIQTKEEDNFFHQYESDALFPSLNNKQEQSQPHQQQQNASELYFQLINSFHYRFLYCDSCLSEIQSFFESPSSSAATTAFSTIAVTTKPNKKTFKPNFAFSLTKLNNLFLKLRQQVIDDNFPFPDDLKQQENTFLIRFEACLLPYGIFEDIMNKRFPQLLHSGNWFVLTMTLVKFIPTIAVCPYTQSNIIPLAHAFISLGKNAKFVHTVTTIQEYYFTNHLLHWALHTFNFLSYRYVAPNALPTSSSSNDASPHAVHSYPYPLLIAIQICQSQLLTELNVLPLMKASYQQSLLSYGLAYDLVQERRNGWRRDKVYFISQFIASQYLPSTAALCQQQQQLSKDTTNSKRLNGVVTGRGNKPYHIQYVTYASEYTDEVKHLLLSAILAGVRLTVLGLEEVYEDYSNKMMAYYHYLHDNLHNLADNDVVVLLDAYDVLLFPSIRHVDEVLMHSPAPIIFCSEAGIYPEYASMFFYARHQSAADNQPYLNSGCILGQVKYLKWLFAQALPFIPAIRDDQQIFLRLMFAFPDMFTLDNSHTFAMTLYQQNTLIPNHLTIATSLQLYQHTIPPFNPFMNKNKNKHSNHPLIAIGLAHANNKGSNGLYALLTNSVYQLFELYYRGTSDSVALLKVIRFMADKQYLQAKELIESSVDIQSNRTDYHNGNGNGNNPIAKMLLHEIEYGIQQLNAKINHNSRK